MSESDSDKKDKKESEDGKASATIDDVKRIVDEAVESFKKLVGGSTDSTNDDTKPTEDKKDARERRPTTYRRTEEDATAKIQEAVKNVLDARDHQAEHDRLKKEPKKEQEKPPNKKRWSTKLMLGKYGDE